MLELNIRPTDKIVTLIQDKGEVPARIWEGKTSTGIPVHCYVTRVAVAANRPDHELAEFDRELRETQAPSPEVATIDARLVL